jgi:hypothetical protein
MGYHPRIETSEMTSHINSRTRLSELWFINNKKLEENILGIYAKYTNKHKVTLYALGIEGNHIHQSAKFPKANRADYTRDTNSMIASAVDRHCEDFPGGNLWARRYSVEFMDHKDDIEKNFFYIALQAVNDGLVDKISDYDGYNFFNDAISGIKRKYKILNRTKYYAACRFGAKVNEKDYTEEYEIVYERLPGYENLTQAEYKKLMLEKLETHRIAVLKERAESGKTASLGKEKLKKKPAGSKPRKTKTIGRFGHRPRTLSLCKTRRKATNGWYFNFYFEYKKASALYRKGVTDVEFPPGSYKPPKFTCACTDTLDSIMEL